jgi:hypothetical protein
MGKAKKEHRAKVAKRNQRMGQEKSKMQKVFNSILEEQMKKFQDNEELNIQVGDSPVEFNVMLIYEFAATAAVPKYEPLK